MKAITQHVYGGPELLTLADIEQPEPATDEVLIEVKAVGLSPGDRAMLTGVPYVNRLAASGLRRPKLPIPGNDVAGVVRSTGKAVTDLDIGDDVFGIAAGSCAEFVVASQEQVFAMPAGWTYCAAAAVPESGGVALQAVRDQAGVHEGQHVPSIDRVFALDETADAMRYLDHRSRPGKVVVTTEDIARSRTTLG